MQNVKPSVILDDAARAMRWDPTKLSDREEGDRRAAFSQAFQQVWEAWWFSILMKCEQIALAPTFTSGSTTAPINVTVYWPLTGGYYLNILAGDNTTDPTDVSGNTTFSGWAKWNSCLPCAPKFDSTADYLAGNQTIFDDVRYQAAQDAPAGSLITDPTFWLPVPDWTPIVPVNGLDGVATGPFGDVRMVSRLDPRTTANAGEFHIEQTGDGYRVLGLDCGRVWVWHRRPTPVIDGDLYDEEITYDATTIADLVWA